MDGGLIFAVVLSAVVVVMLVIRAIRVGHITRQLRGEGRALPRSAYVFWALAAVALVLVLGTWTFVLIE